MRLAPIPTTVVTVLAAGALIGAAAAVDAPQSVTQEGETSTVPVAQRTLVCPSLGGSEVTSAMLGMLALGEGPGEASGQSVPDEAVVTPLAPPADLLEDGAAGESPTASPSPSPSPTESQEVLTTVDERQAVIQQRVEVDEPTSYAVRATGAMAPGFTAEQSVVADSSEQYGLAGTSCSQPAREHWFVGSTGEVGDRGRLVLSNPSEAPAVVDVNVWDDSGDVSAPGTQDIGVPAGGQVMLLVDALAPDAPGVGLQVSASQGQVSAAIESRLTEGVEPQGLSYIPAASPPSTDVVVPGIPASGERTLQVFAPGDTDAIVTMRILGPDGPFSPAGQDVVTVPAGTVVDVPLDDAVGNSPAAVELSSDQPVTAAARTVVPPEDGSGDHSVSSAAAPLQGPAATLLGRTSWDYDTSLVLSSVSDQPAGATVQFIDDAGEVIEEEEVDVAPGATATVDVPAVSGATFSRAVVQPQAPDTLAAARWTRRAASEGAAVDVAPLVSPPSEVTVPEVVSELPADLEPPEPGSGNSGVD
ncbi:MAG TPA: DUF5719 family protein [Jiangellaceae bacterium]|nr:DUF5719 family protein [Jiangellaceae bacterium]